MKKIKKLYFAIRKMYINIGNKDNILLYLTCVYMFTFSFFDLIVAYFPKILLDLCMKEQKIEKMWLFISIYLILGCFFGWLNCVIREYAKAKIGYLRIDYLTDAFNKIITANYKYMEDSTFFNKYDSAFDACSNAENGIEKVYNILFELPAILLKIISFSIILSTFSPVVVLAVVLHVVVSFNVKKKAAVYKYKYREEFSKVNRKRRYFSSISQDFQYGKDIRLYGFKNILNKKYINEVDKYKNLFAEVKNKEFILNITCSITMIISDIAIYSVLVLKAYAQITISEITMYFLVVNMLIHSINLAVTYCSDIYGEGLFIADYFEFINTDLSNDEGEDTYFINQNDVSIQINDFSFKYPNTERYIYKNLNLSISGGEKIALVGNNGVGKSTLIKVLIGLFRDFEGDILIEGKSIKKMNNRSLFSIFSVVFQDVNLLAYTVSENITGKVEGGDKNKIWEVLEMVGLRKKIEETSKGLEQQVYKYIDEDGLEFSGGEGQKMAIARAIYKDAKVFILDEPTASLDALAEKEIYEKFGEITKGKTTIFISHRLASTKFCDRIILLGSDGVLEQGTHEELMKLKGKYFEMFNLQGKYYK